MPDEKEKLFKWQNITSFFRSVFEPHIVAVTHKVNSLFQNNTFGSYFHMDIIPRPAIIDIGTIIIWPSASRMPNQEYYLECNGQSVPSGERFNQLRSIVGSTVPNLNDYFLRSTVNTSKVLDKVSDKLRTHTHEVTTNLTNRSISGTAAGQKYFDMKSGIFPVGSSPVQGSSEFKHHVENIFSGILDSSFKKSYVFNAMSPVRIIGNTNPTSTSVSIGEGSGTVNIPGRDVYHSADAGWGIWGADGGSDYAASSSVTGSVNNGKSTGEAHATGQDETCPKHIFVRFFIRARH